MELIHSKIEQINSYIEESRNWDRPSDPDHKYILIEGTIIRSNKDQGFRLVFMTNESDVIYGC